MNDSGPDGIDILNRLPRAAGTCSAAQVVLFYRGRFRFVSYRSEVVAFELVI
ncbi:MAG TPA: hypothetical protein VKB88_19185 [Bryobacteraceae bacterium]|nr:hypothetical protein [Bryobacteraceae bacterium]